MRSIEPFVSTLIVCYSSRCLFLLLRGLSLQCPHELRDPSESLPQPAVICREADAHMPQPAWPKQIARGHLDALLLEQPICELSSGQSHLPDRHPEEEA